METKFDWGSTRRTIASIATPLIALLALRGIDVGPAFQSTLTVVDAIVAASGPLYALASNLRAMLKDYHAAKVSVVSAVRASKDAALAHLDAPVLAPTSPSTVLGQ